ncbi:hypothetical protein AAC387_Pa05g2401 [Persea americana]
MDEYTEQRGGGELAISRRGSSLSCRDTSHEDRGIQCSNRLGGSTRLSSMKGTNTINQEKAKCSKPSFHFSSSETTVGSSSKSSTGMSNRRKHHQEQHNPDSLKQAVTGISIFRKHHKEQQNPVVLKESVMGMSNLRKLHQEQQQNTDPLMATLITISKHRQQEVEADKRSPSTTGTQTGQIGPQNAETVAFHRLSMNATEEVGDTRPQKPIQQSEFGTQDTSMGSSIRHSFSSKNANQYPNPEDQGANARCCGLRSLGCASISDIIPSNSMSDLGHSRKKNVTKQRCHTDGESSSARGKKTGESSGISSHRNDFSSPSLRSTVRLASQPSSRRMRNQSTSGNVPSVGTRRRISVDISTRHSRSNNVNIMIPHLGQAEFSNNESASGSSSQSFSRECPSFFLNSLRWPGSSDETTRRSRPIAHPVNSSAQPFGSFSLGQDGFRHLNMEITEALLALERAERAEELTYEQLLALESNLFLGGIRFYDQHRGMRLDIDNMSYEELLALEEKMGTVRIALTEEQLLNCVKRSCYVPAHVVSGIVGHDDDDAKCSICQEEYVVGDEVGKLGCKHQYHVKCIYQWLKQKNWCPICKALAAPS